MSKKEQLFRENYNLGYVYSNTLKTGHLVFVKAMKSNTDCSISKEELIYCPKFLKNAKAVHEKLCTYHSDKKGFEKYYAEVLCGKWNLLKPLSVVKNTGKYFIHDDSISPRNVYTEPFEDELFSLLQGKKFGLTDSFDTEYKVFYKDKEGRVLPSPTTELEFIEYKEKGFEIQYKQFLSLHRIIRIGNYLVMFALFPSMEELENAYEGKLKDSRASIDANEYFGLVLEFCGCPSHTITNKYRIRKAGKDENGKKHKGSKIVPILLQVNRKEDLSILDNIPPIEVFDEDGRRKMKRSFTIEDLQYINANEEYIKCSCYIRNKNDLQNVGVRYITYNGRVYSTELHVYDRNECKLIGVFMENYSISNYIYNCRKEMGTYFTKLRVFFKYIQNGLDPITNKKLEGRIYLHHIIPLLGGGTNDLENLILLNADTHYALVHCDKSIFSHEFLLSYAKYNNYNIEFLKYLWNGLGECIEYNAEDTHIKEFKDKIRVSGFVKVTDWHNKRFVDIANTPTIDIEKYAEWYEKEGIEESRKRARTRGEFTDVLLCFVSAMYGRFSDCFVEGVYDLTPKKLAILLNEKFCLTDKELLTVQDISNAKKRVAPMPLCYYSKIEYIKRKLEE